MGDCSLLESREGEREVTREGKEEERKWRAEVRDRKRPENMIHTLQIALMLQIRDTNSSYLPRYLQYLRSSIQMALFIMKPLQLAC